MTNGPTKPITSVHSPLPFLSEKKQRQLTQAPCQLTELQAQFDSLSEGSYQFYLSRQHCVLITDPRRARQILGQESAQFPKVRKKRHALGNGLLTAESDSWKIQRESAVFQLDENLVDWLPTFEQQVDQLIARWKKHPNSFVIDTGFEMSHLVLSCLGRTLFNYPLEEHSQSVHNAINTLVKTYPTRWQTLRGLLIPGQQTAHQSAFSVLRKVCEQLAHHCRSQSSQNSFAQALRQAEEKTNSTDGPATLVEQISTYILTAVETTSSLLFWTLELLARHTHYQHELSQHLNGPQKDLRLAAYLKESLRLYPPIWRLIRQCQSASNQIPEGSQAWILPFLFHRSSRYWNQPNEFRPERFLRSTPSTQCFMPFGSGTRSCVGKIFAMSLAEIAISKIVRNFKLSTQNRDPIHPLGMFSLRPERSLSLSMTQRIKPPSRKPPHLRASPSLSL